jgi:hypothetical protein
MRVYVLYDSTYCAPVRTVLSGETDGSFNKQCNFQFVGSYLKIYFPTTNFMGFKILYVFIMRTFSKFLFSLPIHICNRKNVKGGPS